MLNLLGIISSVAGKITDSFNRTNTTSTLGNTDTGNAWSILTGTWKINNNKAESTSNASDYALAKVDLGSFNASVSADVTSGGVGPAVWVSDANSWWASSVNYRSVFTDTSFLSCSGGPKSGKCSAGCGSESSSQQCGGLVAGNTYTTTGSCPSVSIPNSDCTASGLFLNTQEGGSSFSYNCNGAGGSSYSAPTVYPCTLSNVGQVCSRTYVGTTGQWYYTTCAQTETRTCRSYSQPTPTTVFSCSNSYVTVGGGYTTYYTDLKLYNKNGGTVTEVKTEQLASNTSSYTAAGSIVISTSGNSITAKAYTGSGLTGSQIGSTLTHNPTSPNKGTSVGIIKTPSTANQGSTLDNFSAQQSQ